MASGDASITSNDRLGFTLFLAITLHALLIFGISFDSASSAESAPSVTVTLATHQSLQAPDEADFVAQENQIGSGSLREAQEITTDQQSPMQSQQIQEAAPMPARKASAARRNSHTPVTTAIAAQTRIQQSPEVRDTEILREGQDSDNIERIHSEIASLNAKLDRQKQRYAKRPRERVLTSVSAKRSVDAAYLAAWADKVKTVGNENFPAAAIAQNITGSLRLQSTINWDGRLLDAEILRSSGHRILDNAALQIVRQASPYLPLPPELREEIDQIVIIRTWNFEIDGLSTAQ